MSKELEAAYRDLKEQYETLLKIIVAVSRAQGPLQVERALYDDQNHEWTIATEPREDESGLTVRALHNGVEVVPQ